MTTLPNYQHDIIDNPVQRLERTHLRRIGMSYFWRGVYAITVLAIIAPILWGFNIYFEKTLEISLFVLFILNVVALVVVEVGIINHSAESIRREFTGKTWDLLLMTGVNTWRLILGKWMGVIRGNRRDIVFLYILRMITVFWGMVAYFLDIDGFHYQYYYQSPPVYGYLSDIRIDLLGFVAIGVIIAVYMFAEVLLVTSLPIPFSLWKFTRKHASTIALVLRVGVPFGLGLFIHAWHYDFPYRFGGVSWWTSLDYSLDHTAFIVGLMTALAEGGYGLSAIVASRHHLEFNILPYVITQLFGLLSYFVLTVVMLRIAKFAAYTKNVSQPGYIAPTKPKRHSPTDTAPTVNMTTVQSPVVSPPPVPKPEHRRLLNLPDAEAYHCEVMRYDRNASLLEIAVYGEGQSTPELTITFGGVSFFTGMMQWTNAGFEVLDEVHLGQHLAQNRMNSGQLPDNTKLYSIPLSGNPVRIIASDVTIHRVHA